MTSTITLITSTGAIVVSGEGLVIDIHEFQAKASEDNGRASAAIGDPMTGEASRVDAGRTASATSERMDVTGGESAATNSHQVRGNGPDLQVEAATETASRLHVSTDYSNSQAIPHPPANAGEPDPSQASPAPHSTGATVETGRAGGPPSAPVTHFVLKLRPNCRRPEACGGYGRKHCHSCKPMDEAAA